MAYKRLVHGDQEIFVNDEHQSGLYQDLLARRWREDVAEPDADTRSDDDQSAPEVTAPAARVLTEAGVPEDEWDLITGTGDGGKVLKADAIAYIEARGK